MPSFKSIELALTETFLLISLVLTLYDVIALKLRRLRRNSSSKR